MRTVYWQMFIPPVAVLAFAAANAQAEPIVFGFGSGAYTAAYDKFGYYHSFNHKTPDNTIDLAEKLVEISPMPEAQAYFATSGSEATETSSSSGAKIAAKYLAPYLESRDRAALR